jgi:hypothetical protein
MWPRDDKTLQGRGDHTFISPDHTTDTLGGRPLFPTDEMRERTRLA